MTTGRTHYCIGGPLAGTQKTVFLGNRFSAPIPVEKVEAGPPGEAVEVRQMQYVLQSIRTPTGDFDWWAPDGQSVHASLNALMSAYVLLKMPKN